MEEEKTIWETRTKKWEEQAERAEKIMSLLMNLETNHTHSTGAGE